MHVAPPVPFTGSINGEVETYVHATATCGSGNVLVAPVMWRSCGRCMIVCILGEFRPLGQILPEKKQFHLLIYSSLSS